MCRRDGRREGARTEDRQRRASWRLQSGGLTRVGYLASLARRFEDISRPEAPNQRAEASLYLLEVISTLAQSHIDAHITDALSTACDHRTSERVDLA